MRFYRYCALLTLLIFISCDNTVSSNSENENYTYNKVYVTLQSTDKIAIVNSHTLEVLDVMDVDLMNMDDGMGMGDMGETPHYIILDETNGYFFVSAIMSNKIGMYSIESNELIASLSVDEDPAILGIDISTKTLYVSRMMIMNMGDMEMGSSASLVDEISYDFVWQRLVQSTTFQPKNYRQNTIEMYFVKLK